jgi:hypothetical protein
MLVDFQQTTHHYIPEDRNIYKFFLFLSYHSCNRYKNLNIQRNVTWMYLVLVWRRNRTNWKWVYAGFIQWTS